MRIRLVHFLSLLLIAWSCLAMGQENTPLAASDWTGSTEQKVHGLAIVWSEAKYAFPSFDHLAGLDWDEKFQEFIPRVIAAEDLEQYYWTLMEFASLLNDGHTSVLPPWGYLKPDFDNPPVEVQVVGDDFLVARAGDTAELRSLDVRPGLKILEIDGVEVRSHFEDSVNRFYARGSRQANEALNVVYLLRGPANSQVALNVEDPDGTKREVVLTRNSGLEGGGMFFPRVLLGMMSDSAIETKTLPGGVRYIRISSFQQPGMEDTFLRLVDDLSEEETAGLLFDLRFCLGGRSDIAEKMIGALIEEPTPSPKWKYPHYVAAHKSWGRAPQWTTGGNTILPRDGKRYTGPVVILTAGTASSTAEDFIISLKHAGRAVLVGEKTAGSAGNPLDFALPGGGRFEVATFRAYLPDGGEYVGIGVQPDLEIRPTREDIVRGADPVLEKGIDVILDSGQYEELTN